MHVERYALFSCGMKGKVIRKLLHETVPVVLSVSMIGMNVMAEETLPAVNLAGEVLAEEEISAEENISAEDISAEVSAEGQESTEEVFSDEELSEEATEEETSAEEAGESTEIKISDEEGVSEEEEISADEETGEEDSAESTEETDEEATESEETEEAAENYEADAKAMAAPSFVVKGVFGGRNVTFNGPEGSKIYYSTTSALTTNDKCVSAGETVLFENFYGTIYAKAYLDGKWSNPAKLILKIPQCKVPVITQKTSKDGGAIWHVECATPEVYLIYTTDGTNPSLTNGTKVKNTSRGLDINVTSNSLKVMAVRSCFSNSEITTESQSIISGDYLYNWNQQDKTATIVKYQGKETEIVIPETTKFNGETYKIVGIEEEAFRYLDTLTSVKISENCTNIGAEAFADCEMLKEVVLPEGVEVLGNGCFMNCKALEEVTVPSGIRSCGDSVFSDSGLKKATVNCAEISGWMFSGCQELTSVTLSEGVTKIGRAAFLNCAKVKEVQLPSTLRVLREACFSGTGVEEITVQGDIYYAHLAFRGSKIKKATMNTSVVPEGIFYGCKTLEKVIFTEKVTSIEVGAFEKCTSLKKIYIPGSCQNIKSAFWGDTALEAVVLGPGVKNLSHSFAHCTSLKTVVMPDSIESIEDSAFIYCRSLEYLYIPEKITKLERYEFGPVGINVIGCEKGSVADNSIYYSEGVKLQYGRSELTKPTMSVTEAPSGKNVVLSCSDLGAVIFYNTTDEIDITSDFAYNGESVHFDSYNGNVYAKSYANGKWSDTEVVSLEITKVETPSISFADGKATVTTTTSEADVIYTIDGSTPSLTNGTRGQGSEVTFGLSGGVTLKAIAVKDGWTVSKMASAKAPSAISGTLQVPSFEVKGVLGGREVTFKGPQGSKVYYSTTSSFTEHSSHVDAGEKVVFNSFYGTIYARTYLNGKWSNPARLILKIPTCKAPDLQVDCTKSGLDMWQMKCATPDVYFIYTTDGSAPSLTNGTKVKNKPEGVIVPIQSELLRVIAVRSCFSTSEEVSKGFNHQHHFPGAGPGMKDIYDSFQEYLDGVKNDNKKCWWWKAWS